MTNLIISDWNGVWDNIGTTANERLEKLKPVLMNNTKILFTSMATFINKKSKRKTIICNEKQKSDITNIDIYNCFVKNFQIDLPWFKSDMIFQDIAYYDSIFGCTTNTAPSSQFKAINIEFMVCQMRNEKLIDKYVILDDWDLSKYLRKDIRPNFIQCIGMLNDDIIKKIIEKFNE